MITGKDIIVNGHKPEVQEEMSKLDHEYLITEVVKSLLNHEIPDMVVGYDEEGDEYFRKDYNENFNRFVSTLTNKEKIWLLIEFKSEYQEMEDRKLEEDPNYFLNNRHLYGKRLSEMIEDIFFTNRMVFNGGLEYIFLEDKNVNSYFEEWEVKRATRKNQ